MTEPTSHEPPAHSITGAPLRPLSPDWPRAERISWFVLDAALLIPSLTAWAITAARDFTLPIHPILLAAWALLAIALLWATLRYPQAAYRHAAVGVGPSGVEFHRGIWWRKATIIPRSRVQHTDVSQGPIMRRFGLGQLVIHTAGTRNAVVQIPGLRHEEALRIRDQLLDGPAPPSAPAPPAPGPAAQGDPPPDPTPPRPDAPAEPGHG